MTSWLNSLKEYNYVTVDYDKGEKGNILRRKIFINGIEKVSSGTEEKVIYNNTRNNTKNILYLTDTICNTSKG